MQDPVSAQEAIVSEFGLFQDWLDRYQYLIDLGRKLPPLDASERVDENLLEGCQSRVWLLIDGDAEALRIRANSDAAIVSGLIALLIRVYSGASAQAITDTDPFFIRELGIDLHDLAIFLGIDLFVIVDHDFRHAFIIEERLDRRQVVIHRRHEHFKFIQSHLHGASGNIGRIDLRHTFIIGETGGDVTGREQGNSFNGISTCITPCPTSPQAMWATPVRIQTNLWIVGPDFLPHSYRWIDDQEY